MTRQISYPGSELELFAHAHNWRSYWASQIRPYIAGKVLEVGAGLGSNTKVLNSPDLDQWVMLEPDPSMVRHLKNAVASGDMGVNCKVINGTLADLDRRLDFDTVLYIDVLEHIADDRAELILINKFLAPGGHLIVLAPAHQWLFSAFDECIGHFRRYSGKALVTASPKTLRVVRTRYLDTAGVLASLTNKILLQSSSPSPAQIRFWDRILVTISKFLDPALFFKVGKSVLVIFRKESTT